MSAPPVGPTVPVSEGDASPVRTAGVVGNGGNPPTFSRELAWDVATEILAALTPGCTRLIFAGDLRRGAPTLNCLEVVFLPRFGQGRAGELFEQAMNLAKGCLAALEAARTMKRPPYVRRPELAGAVHRPMVHTLSGLPVELFEANPGNWANLLVCRTGPATLTARLADAARARGYRWNPFGAGFTRLDDGAEVPAATEKEVFEVAGLPFRPAHER